MATVTSRKPKRSAKWDIDLDRSGWLTIRKPASGIDALEMLRRNDALIGPVKLMENHKGIEQRADVFLGCDQMLENDRLLDAEAHEESEALRAELLDRASSWFGEADGCDGWDPPESATLSMWLAEAGYENAIDDEGNLRLAIKRRGCDGQIRVMRGDGRLRLAMPLGSWTGLDAATESAVVRLAGEANARSRLARVAWRDDGDRRHVEAQVDLTGLPVAENLSSAMATMWKETIRMALSALELMLRRLGLELPLLADAKQPELIDWMSVEEKPKRKPRKKPR